MLLCTVFREEEENDLMQTSART